MTLNRPVLTELSCDNIFIPENILSTLSPLYKNSYSWEIDPFQNEDVLDWKKPYAVVMYANLVIETLNKLSGQSNSADVMGQALFYRSASFFDLAQLFSKPYFSATANSDLGIPLTLTTDPKHKTGRSTVQQTYDQIINDLEKAAKLLPDTASFKTRPSKAAANALLSRVYLSTGNFDMALQYASRSLSIYNTIIDYNLVPNTNLPFKDFKGEVIWESVMISSPVFNLSGNCPADTVLYNSYHVHDLRKDLYFNKTGATPTFKGTYEGTRIASKFVGLATDELMFTKAECYARMGHIEAAMEALNAIMKKRWSNTVVYVPFSANSKEEALVYILQERRKELVYRGVRWIDLRRLNVLGAGIRISRQFNGRTITLEPNSNRYVFPIPKEELLLNPMEDNPRQ